MAITLGLVEAVDDNGVYVTMPGSKGVLRGPYKALSTVAAGTTVLVASTDDGEQVVIGTADGGEGVYNVRAFGAKGDGVTDDTVAIQAAIDAARGGPVTGSPPYTSTTAHAVVYLPPGRYRITDTLEVTGVQGLDFVGAGRRSSLLCVDGELTVALKCVGLSFGRLADFGIQELNASASVDSGIDLDWTPSDTSGSSYNVILERLAVTDLKFERAVGIGVNSSTYDVNQVILRDLFIIGDLEAAEVGSYGTTWYQSGVRLGSGSAANVLNFWLDNCSIGYLRRAVHIDAVNQVSLSKVCATKVDDYAYKTGPGVLAIRDARIEDSIRLVDTGEAGYASMCQIENVYWDPGADATAISGVFIRWNYSGTLILRNIFTSPLGHTVTPQVVVNPYLDLAVIVDGFVANQVDSAYEKTTFQVAASNAVIFTVKGYIAIDDEGAVQYVCRPNRTWATTWYTDAETRIDTALRVDGEVGFQGAAPIAKPTVTGSRGGNAALASLITALASYGLITDSSS